jgi:hypothetical protein
MRPVLPHTTVSPVRRSRLAGSKIQPLGLAGLGSTMSTSWRTGPRWSPVGARFPRRPVDGRFGWSGHRGRRRRRAAGEHHPDRGGHPGVRCAVVDEGARFVELELPGGAGGDVAGIEAAIVGRDGVDVGSVVAPFDAHAGGDDQVIGLKVPGGRVIGLRLGDGHLLEELLEDRGPGHGDLTDQLGVEGAAIGELAREVEAAGPAGARCHRGGGEGSVVSLELVAAGLHRVVDPAPCCSRSPSCRF